MNSLIENCKILIVGIIGAVIITYDYFRTMNILEEERKKKKG